MAIIRDELILADRFSNALRDYADGLAAAARATRAANGNMVSTTNMAATQRLQTYQSMMSGIQREMLRMDVVNAAQVRQSNALAAAGKQESEAFKQLDSAMERAGQKYRELGEQKKVLKQTIETVITAYRQEQAAAEQAAQAQMAAAARTAVQTAQSMASNTLSTVPQNAAGAQNAIQAYARAVISAKQQTDQYRLSLQMESQMLQLVIEKYGAGSAAAMEQAQAVKRAADAVNQGEMRTRAYQGALEQAAGGARQAAQAVDQYRNSVNSANTATSGLMTSVRNLAGAFLGLQGIKNIVGLSDSMVQTRARLDILTGGEGTDELQKMIFQSAQRSRGDYFNTADMVSKMGIMAGDAFQGPQELVAFTEMLNKMYTVSGTKPAQQWATNLQLQQAMAMGVLRGQEYKTIAQNAQALVQAIGKSLGVSTGEVKKMADEGRITAAVVKNAMFSAADDVNSKFETMPMTWSQVWTVMKNEAIMASQPLLDAVNAVAQHWETLKPIFIGVAAGISAMAVAWGIYTVAQTLANIAIWTNPLIWIAVAVGIAVAAIYQFIQAVGGLKVAWLITVDFVKTWGDKLKIFFWSFVYGVQDAFGDLKAGVLTDLEAMLNASIDLINSFIEELNKIPGVSINLIEHTTFGTVDALKNDAAKQNRANELASMEQKAADEHRWRQMTIDGTRELSAAAKDNGFNFSSMVDELGAINKNTGQTAKNTADLADEDFKYLEDVAIRRYEAHINSTSLVPQITVQVDGRADRETAEDIAGRIAAILRREAASATSLTFAEV